MTNHLCGYCQAVAVTTVPAIPDRVCRQHAEEFWQGVIADVGHREEPLTTPDPPTSEEHPRKVAPVTEGVSKSPSRR